MKNPGFLKILFAALLGTIALQSCDMGKYYFRMHPGGKSQQPRNAVQEKPTSQSFGVSGEKALPSTANDIIVEQEETDDPFLTTSEQAVPAQKSSKAVQYEPANKSPKKSSPVKAESKKREKRASMSPKSQVAFGIWTAIALLILGICVLLFLALWIFVPAVLAFKIALLAFGIAVLAPTIWVIAVFCFGA